jgi:hypothetical protein
VGVPQMRSEAFVLWGRTLLCHKHEDRPGPRTVSGLLPTTLTAPWSPFAHLSLPPLVPHPRSSLLKGPSGRAPVAHACNPSYSEGRDQEDGSLKPARANSLRDPIWKKPFIKRAGRVAQGEGPEFKSQSHPKKKRSSDSTSPLASHWPRTDPGGVGDKINSQHGSRHWDLLVTSLSVLSPLWLSSFL